MTPFKTLLATVPLLFTFACNNGPIGSCDTRPSTGAQEGICRTWTGERTASEEQFRTLCTQTLGGTFAGGEGCIAAERLGTCYTDQLFGLFLTYSYYAPHFTSATAEAACLARSECTASSCEWRLGE